MCKKVDKLFKKSIQNQARMQRAVECFTPELQHTPWMPSHSVISKYIPGVPRTEWA